MLKNKSLIFLYGFILLITNCQNHQNSIKTRPIVFQRETIDLHSTNNIEVNDSEMNMALINMFTSKCQ